MPQFSATTDHLMNLFKKRHSGRTYDPNQKVSREQIQTLITAALLAPSCYNEQPWCFLISEKNETPDTYNKILGSLVEFNQNWARNAPVLLVVCHRTKFAKNQKPNRWGPYDSGAAGFAFMLAATEMGLMAHQMGGFDEQKIHRELALPDDVIAMSVMAVGYEGETDEVYAKDRKPQTENFFWDKWGKPFNQKK